MKKFAFDLSLEEWLWFLTAVQVIYWNSVSQDFWIIAHKEKGSIFLARILARGSTLDHYPQENRDLVHFGQLCIPNT